MCWLARPRRRGAPDGPEARTVWEVSYLALTLCAGESSGLAVGVGEEAGLSADTMLSGSWQAALPGLSGWA